MKDSEETQWERLLWQIKLKQKSDTKNCQENWIDSCGREGRPIGRTGSQGSTEATDEREGRLIGPVFPNWRGSTEATDVEGAKTSFGHNF